ncbi:Beta-(1,2)-xylosyltransferase [Phytophthora citrophthora]|uniref:Beta-(1,2)-xylosyltransferase n=1 Tax=Phytophthora citrophthora TaxID=4793 RepID=A0AAD9LKG5_9STRA|nr:Beta-(1,2)-xylosyltransferase [Phytophthora citrophthora]
MAFVSFYNFFECFESFRFPRTSRSSSQQRPMRGSINSIDNQRLQMYPFGIQHFQQAIRKAPVSWTVKASKDECITRDYGVLEQLKNSSRRFCTEVNSSSPYKFFHVPSANLKGTMLENFILDLRGAEVAQDIKSLAEDGGGHDPRFKYMENSTFCSCSEPQDQERGAPNIWKDFFVGGPSEKDPNCKPLPEDSGFVDKLTVRNAVVLVRRDDHNPFFQISGILNAWSMMQTLGWERNTTQLVTFDRALPTPVDELRHALLGPEKPIISGEVFQNRVVHLESALLAPYEATGPLMTHLDDHQPCYANEMLRDFRDLALKSLRVTPHNAKTDPKRCLVTVISRRPYGGRRVQRMWQNEDEILDKMREEYRDGYRFGECEFQSLEFTNMTMHDQMRVMLDSDVVIGMHGAGMVNVMWTRPETLVVEIFPRRRFRWGYRNICQFLGCRWNEFRRGRDVRIHTSDANDMDKIISYPEWKSFFDPLFRSVVEELEQKVEGK